VTIFATLLASPFVGGCGAAIASVWSDGNPVWSALGAVVMVLIVFVAALGMVSARIRGEAVKENTRRENEEIRQYFLRKAREDES